eukprot:TRINITY_DN24340_c0_g1_i1.p1 TRINITY_DN24340_c0_g1~~TRINITY_DN24340_c0_g1_i1.p1  ORF type:complete len:330 (+),score=64.80 TRINITY_DN24340_c0_g1_i1:10-999(+)
MNVRKERDLDFRLGARPSAVTWSSQEEYVKQGKKLHSEAHHRGNMLGGCIPIEAVRKKERKSDGKHHMESETAAIVRYVTKGDARSCSRGLAEVLKNNPWKPGGAMRTYSPEIVVECGSKKLSEKDQSSLVKRLYDDSLKNQQVCHEKLFNRYCAPKKRGRVLSRRKMEHQFIVSKEWDKAVSTKLEKQYNPTPPVEKTAPLTGHRLRRSASRLHKGLANEDADDGYDTIHDRLYNRYEVRSPPATLTWSSRGAFSRPSPRINKTVAAESGQRLSSNAMQDKKDVNAALHEKYITTYEKKYPVKKKQEWNELVAYLSTGGDQPAYRSPR